MSYILDALRRADSERERGSVPGIHAQPVPPQSSPEREAAPRAAPWLWGATGLALALAGVAGWSALSRSGARDDARIATAVPAAGEAAVPSPATSPPVSTAAPAPLETAPAPMTATAPTPTPPSPTPGPTAGTRPVPAPGGNAAPSPSAAPSQAIAPAPPATRAPQPKPTTTAALHPALQAMAAAAPPAASSSAAADSRVYAMSELPPTIQRELPKLEIGGSMYSENRASRFIVINGQLLHENDKVAPDLVLEQIKLKAAVLRYKNWRYGITY